MADPRLLLVDTSGSSCGVALSQGELLLGECILSHGKVRSSSLLAAVESLLAETGTDISSVDGFAVTTGPGSFTGLRVGLATVKGLALSVSKPVVPLSSLALLALNLPLAPLPVCPMYDARKKEVYAALYDNNGSQKPIIADTVAPPEEFVSRIEGNAIFLGDGARAYRETIVNILGPRALFAPASFDVPRPSSGIVPALRSYIRGEVLSPDLLVPSYIRPSEAELAKTRG